MGTLLGCSVIGTLLGCLVMDTPTRERLCKGIEALPSCAVVKYHFVEVETIGIRRRH